MISIFCLLISLQFGFAAEVQHLDLKSSIDLAMQKNAELKAQRVEEKFGQSDLDKISGEFGPRLDGVIGVGPITKATGNATNATEDKDTWGRSYAGGIHFSQPLFSWGRKGLYQKAAIAAQEVKREDTRLKESELRFNVKEAYYGLLYTNSLQDFIQGVKQDLEKSLADSAKSKNPKENFRLELFLQEVESKTADVKQNHELAKAGFALRVGNAPSGSILPKEEWLLPTNRKLESFDHYAAIAREARPEFRQLRLGITARRAQASAEWKGLIPVFGVLIGYDYASTNVRPAQPGVFAYDPYNRHVVTAGVGFKFDLQYDLQKGKAERAEAEAEELEAKQEYADQGILVELQKAYAEVAAADQRLDAETKAYKTGKKWLTSQMMSVGTGLGKGSDLVDAYGARAETAKNYFEAVYKHHMAWAALSRAAGREVDPTLQ